MFDTKSARATLRLAIIVLALGGLAGVWEVLAIQAPGSPLYLGTLPGPVQTLREAAFTLGFLLLFASLALPRLAQAPGSRLLLGVVVSLYLGTALSLGASLYGAAHGMHGEQLLDLRPDAAPLFVVKHVGHLLVGGALFTLAVGMLRGLRRE